MPHKPTGPYNPLWSEQGVEAARKAEQKRKRANAEAYRYRDEESLKGGPEGPASDYAEEVPDFSQESSMPSRMSLLSKGDPLHLWIVFAVVFVLAIQGAAHWALAATLTQRHAEYMESELIKAKMALCLGTSPQSTVFYVNWLDERYREVTHRHHFLRCEDMGLPKMDRSR